MTRGADFKIPEHRHEPLHLKLLNDDPSESSPLESPNARTRDTIAMLRRAGIAFAVAVVLYVGFYSCDHHLRNRHGPWQLTFYAEKNPGEGAWAASVTIDQPALGITNRTIRFSGVRLTQPAPVSTLQFESPADTLQVLPFGSLVFHDLMYLPGTLTFDFFGHQVELLPRVLIVEGTEHPWVSDRVLEIAGPAP